MANSSAFIGHTFPPQMQCPTCGQPMAVGWHTPAPTALNLAPVWEHACSWCGDPRTVAIKAERDALRSQLRAIAAQASSIVAAHHRWFATPTPCGAVCSDEMAAIQTAALAIRAACRAGEGK